MIELQHLLPSFVATNLVPIRVFHLSTQRERGKKEGLSSPLYSILLLLLLLLLLLCLASQGLDVTKIWSVKRKTTGLIMAATYSMITNLSSIVCFEVNNDEMCSSSSSNTCFCCSFNFVISTLILLLSCCDSSSCVWVTLNSSSIFLHSPYTF